MNSYIAGMYYLIATTNQFINAEVNKINKNEELGIVTVHSYLGIFIIKHNNKTVLRCRESFIESCRIKSPYAFKYAYLFT